MADAAKTVITRTVTVSDLSPAELASIFANYDDTQQARFFDCLADEVKDWPGTGWCMQCSYIEGKMTDRAKDIVRKLAEWIGA